MAECADHRCGSAGIGTERRLNVTIMVNLTLKRAKFSRPSGQWQDEDYDVLADWTVLLDRNVTADHPQHHRGVEAAWGP